MQFKVTEYNRNKRSVTATEKFFSLQDFRQRGPEALAEEFRQIQDENLKVNRDFYQVLQDAQTMGVPKFELKKILRQRGISGKNTGKLLRGVLDNLSFNSRILSTETLEGFSHPR